MTADPELLERLEQSEALILPEMDQALVGIEEQSGVAVYDTDGILKILMDRDGMDYQDALDYYEFNILGSYVGEMTPIYIDAYPQPKDQA